MFSKAIAIENATPLPCVKTQGLRLLSIIQEELHVSTVSYLKNKLHKKEITDEDVYRYVSGTNNIEL